MVSLRQQCISWRIYFRMEQYQSCLRGYFGKYSRYNCITGLARKISTKQGLLLDNQRCTIEKNSIPFRFTDAWGTPDLPKWLSGGNTILYKFGVLYFPFLNILICKIVICLYFSMLNYLFMCDIDHGYWRRTLRTLLQSYATTTTDHAKFRSKGSLSFRQCWSRCWLSDPLFDDWRYYKDTACLL